MLKAMKARHVGGCCPLGDDLAFKFAFGLTAQEAQDLSHELTQMRNSPRGLSAVGVRLLRAIEARRLSERFNRTPGRETPICA